MTILIIIHRLGGNHGFGSQVQLRDIQVLRIPSSFPETGAFMVPRNISKVKTVSDAVLTAENTWISLEEMRNHWILGVPFIDPT
jgi:hypothetical protein